MFAGGGTCTRNSGGRSVRSWPRPISGKQRRHMWKYNNQNNCWAGRGRWPCYWCKLPPTKQALPNWSPLSIDDGLDCKVCPSRRTLFVTVHQRFNYIPNKSNCIISIDTPLKLKKFFRSKRLILILLLLLLQRFLFLRLYILRKETKKNKRAEIKKKIKSIN